MKYAVIRDFFCRVGEASVSFFIEFRQVTAFFGGIVFELCKLIRHPKTLRRREFRISLVACGPNAVPISILICLLMGLIMAYQSAVQMHRYGADAFLPALIGCSIVRELGPLMIAVIATGRVGSAFTAEIATMKSTEEINAMITMGLSPWRFLVVPKVLAMLIVTPVLTLLGDAAGIAGGLFVGMIELKIPFKTYILSTITWVPPRFFVESIVKGLVFSFIITMIACYRGFESKGDALGIGHATTLSVVYSIVAIIISDAMLAKIFNLIFYGF